MDSEIAKYIQKAITALRDRQERYALFAAYYRGDHRLSFATEKFRTTFGTLFKAFSDNLCPSVVDAVADRLILTDFGIDTEEATDTSVGASTADSAWEIWEANRMDRRAGEAHLEALRTGDAYVIVWPDIAGNPVIYPNKARAVIVFYDEEIPGRIMWAAKCWENSDKYLRLNLYFTDRLEKYITLKKTEGVWPEKASSFVEYNADNMPYLVPNEYGKVPVFHLTNNAGVGEFGQSELTNVIPLQDALNKSIMDMLVGMEFAALPQRWVAGLEIKTDPITGLPEQPFDPGIDRLWAFANDNARAGEFAAASMEQFIKVQEGFRAEIARVSKTPLHYMMLQSGDFPSGEAMKTAEAPFLAKTRDRMGSFGSTWEDVMSFAMLIAGKGEIKLGAHWKDPAPRNEMEFWQTALFKQQAGVSQKQTLKEGGYAEQEIADMLAEKAKAQAQALQQQQTMMASTGQLQRSSMTNGKAPIGA